MRISRRKVYIGTIVLAVLLGLALYLRSPYVSNALKKTIIEELESATGHQVVVSRIYVNMFPLFVGLDQLGVLDDSGNGVFTSEKTKAYINLSGIVFGTLTVDRILFEGASFNGSGETIQRFKAHSSGRRKKGSGKFVNIDVRSIVFKDSDASYDFEYKKTRLSATGLDMEIVIKKEPAIVFKLDKFAASMSGWPELSAAIKGKARVDGQGLIIDSYTVESFGSEIKGRAVLSRNSPSEVYLDATVLAESVKRLLELETTGEGTLYARGSVTLPRNLIDTSLDLAFGGDFHLDTLLEALRVKDPFGLAGHIFFSGKLKGPVVSMNGEAQGHMTDGALFGIYPDRLESTVQFKDNVLSFPDLTGLAYRGKGSGYVEFSLPFLKTFNVDIDFEEIDNEPIQKLIAIDWLPLPKGKIDGNFQTFGSSFKPQGFFNFKTTTARNDPFGRLRTIKGKFSMENNLLALSDINARSRDTRVVFSGSTDLSSKEIDFKGYATSTNVKDLLTPYFNMLSGSGRIDAKVTGTHNDPLVRGHAKLNNIMLEEYMFGRVNADFTLNRDALKVTGLLARHDNIRHKASGTVHLSGNTLMPSSIEEVRYDLLVDAKQSDLGALVSLLGLGSGVKGILNTVVTFKGSGTTPVIDGSASIENASIYARNIDYGDFVYGYADRTFSSRKGEYYEGGGSLDLYGKISLDGPFSFNATSKGVHLGNLLGNDQNIDYLLDVNASGSGTIESPEISFEGDIRNGVHGTNPLRDARARGDLIGRNYSLSVRSVDDVTNINATGTLTGNMPWKADVNMNYGRFDFLLASIMDNPPEDLALGLEGSISLWGDRNSVNADAKLDRVFMNLYGQGFNSLASAEMTLRDMVLTVPGLSMRGGNSVFTVSGKAELEESLDLNIKGRSTLAPLPGFVPFLETAKGSALLDLDVGGLWNSPVLSGELEIVDGIISLKDEPQRITNINGKIRFEDGKAVADGISAQVGGGAVLVEGNVAIDGLSVSSLRIDLKLQDISYYVSRNFITNVGGTILIAGDTSSQKVTGELWIDKALYSERIEWKSWLVSRGIGKPRPVGDWRRNVDLNIRVFGSKNIKVDNNIADASLVVDLVLHGSLESPLLLGRIASDKGKFFFRNTQFTIAHATADYSNTTSLSPYINIRAQSSVGGYLIWLNLEGRLHDMDLALSSDPPLDDVEILGLLAHGGTGESLSGLEGGLGAAEATSLLTGQMQDVVEERFTDITGFDRVQVAPSVSKETGEVVPRVTVSKRLFKDKLFLTYSSTLGDENEQEMNIEYPIGDNISLMGGQEDTGSVGADLKFRFRFE